MLTPCEFLHNNIGKLEFGNPNLTTVSYTHENIFVAKTIFITLWDLIEVDFFSRIMIAHICFNFPDKKI